MTEERHPVWHPPTQRERELVGALSLAFVKYHGDDGPNFACLYQAASLLCAPGAPFSGRYDPADFIDAMVMAHGVAPKPQLRLVVNEPPDIPF